MDKQHAKLILQSFRPDGADAGNPDFAEALQMCAEDRELSMWLAQERANDAVFAEALMTVDIPDGLRDEILSVMNNEVSGKDLNSELDSLFIGAVASINPPRDLRDKIISAMEVERDSRVVTEKSHQPENIVKFPMRWFNTAAVAALFILGAIFILPEFTAKETKLATVQRLKLAEVQMGTGNFLNAAYEVDISNDTMEGVNTWLAGQGMPVANTVPKGLVSCDVKGGCKLSLDNGVQASMIQFKKKGKGEYYLIILDVNSVEDADKLLNLSEVKLQKCKNCPYTKFNIRSWRDEDKAYILLTKSNSKELSELF